MFIREYKTHNKKTNSDYITHRLVQTIRTDKGPRQKIILNLGQLILPKSEWKKLAHALEAKLSGQESLLDNAPQIDALATRAIEHNRLVQDISEREETKKEKQQLLTIDLKSVKTRKNRSLGPELVANCMWNILGLTQILQECGFDQKQVCLSKAVIMGRLIAPGSDLSTYHWFQSRSSLPEMLSVDLTTNGKDMFYEIVDSLLEQKNHIEGSLRVREKKMFPGGDSIFLYDLTNTYFEGTSLGNTLAAHGKCKSKRSDCPLVTLALVVDSYGFPIFSQIYKGNQSEPETFTGVLKKLNEDLSGHQVSFMKPTIVMDRGIATKDNIKHLKENHYPYIIIERGDIASQYINEFQNSRETFEKLETTKKSSYGDFNNVYIKKIEHTDTSCRVLCLSEGKERKEKGIDRKKEGRFIEELLTLNLSIGKGSIKRYEKVCEKVGRIRQKYAKVSKHYDISVDGAENGHATMVKWTKLPAKEERKILSGCYVIETTHTELGGKEIWKLYMTLTRIEGAFKSLKSELGFRPVFHHSSKRTEGHLFISVLAYHLLNVLERKLSEGGNFKMWKTIRDELSTHQRNTVVFTADEGSVHHYTISSEPESEHMKIYELLGVKDPLKPVHQLAKYSL